MCQSTEKFTWKLESSLFSFQIQCEEMKFCLYRYHDICTQQVHKFFFICTVCVCRVRVQEVPLSSRSNSSSRGDRAVNLAHVFERRRAIMDAAIVRIMKKEKQMSVDNIALKVLFVYMCT